MKHYKYARFKLHHPTVFIFLIITFFILAAPSYTALALTVTNTDDSGPGSLRDAIAITDPGGTVDFDPSLTNQTITLTTGEIIIDKDLTIMGLGPSSITISGDNNSRIFNIQFANVVISDLKIADGLESCDILDCTVSGGAIRASGFGSGLEIRNSILSNNKLMCNAENCSTFGGAIFYGGGNPLIIDNSTFSNNEASCEGAHCPSLGGAITEFADVGGADINITNSKFSGNMATCIGEDCGSNGGVMYTPDPDGLVDIRSSTFSGNMATCEGVVCASNSGAFSSSGEKAYEISSSTLFDNMATCEGLDCLSFAGAMLASMLTLTNSTISTNEASCEGESCVARGGALRLNNTTEINNVTFSENLALCSGSDCTSNGSTIASSFDQIMLTNSIVHSDIMVAIDNCFGSIIDGGNNLQFPDQSCLPENPPEDPLLGPLQDNGGPTFTRALLPGSPAIDAGNDGTCEAFDQRGILRPIDGDGDDIAVCDIGAFEVEEEPAPTPTPTPTPSPTPTPGGDGFAPGDANGDGSINILDVTVILNDVLEISSAPGNGNCNEDGEVNILDVTCVLNIILGG